MTPAQLTHTHAKTPKHHLVPPPSEQNPLTHRITWGQWASRVTTVTGQEGVVGRSSCYIRLIQILIILPPSSPSPHTHHKTFLPRSSPFLLYAPSSSPSNFACCPWSLPASLFSPFYRPQAFSLPLSRPPPPCLVTPSRQGGRSTQSEVFLREFVVNQTRLSWLRRCTACSSTVD